MGVDREAFWQWLMRRNWRGLGSRELRGQLGRADIIPKATFEALSSLLYQHPLHHHTPSPPQSIPLECFPLCPLSPRSHPFPSPKHVRPLQRFFLPLRRTRPALPLPHLLLFLGRRNRLPPRLRPLGHHLRNLHLGRGARMEGEPSAAGAAADDGGGAVCGQVFWEEGRLLG